MGTVGALGRIITTQFIPNDVQNNCVVTYL